MGQNAAVHDRPHYVRHPNDTFLHYAMPYE